MLEARLPPAPGRAASVDSVFASSTGGNPFACFRAHVWLAELLAVPDAHPFGSPTPLPLTARTRFGVCAVKLELVAHLDAQQHPRVRALQLNHLQAWVWAASCWLACFSRERGPDGACCPICSSISLSANIRRSSAPARPPACLPAELPAGLTRPSTQHDDAQNATMPRARAHLKLQWRQLGALRKRDGQGGVGDKRWLYQGLPRARRHRRHRCCCATASGSGTAARRGRLCHTKLVLQRTPDVAGARSSSHGHPWRARLRRGRWAPAALRLCCGGGGLCRAASLLMLVPCQPGALGSARRAATRAVAGGRSSCCCGGRQRPAASWGEPGHQKVCDGALPLAGRAFLAFGCRLWLGSAAAGDVAAAAGSGSAFAPEKRLGWHGGWSDGHDLVECKGSRMCEERLGHWQGWCGGTSAAPLELPPLAATDSRAIGPACRRWDAPV